MQRRAVTDGSGEAAKRRLLFILSICMIVGGTVVAIATLVAWSLGQGALLDVAGVGGIALTGLLVYILTRQGRPRAGGLVLVGLLILIPTYFVLFEGPKITALLLFTGGVVFADFFVGGRSGLIVAATEIALYAAAGLVYEAGWTTHAAYVTPFPVDMITVGLVLFSLALAAGSFTRLIRGALQQAEERESALRAADAEKDRLLTELQAREEAQRRLLEMVGELGSPVIPLAEGIVAMPLIGIIDSERAQQLRMALLDGVAAHRARVAIVDITGVPLVDTMVAGTLLQAAKGIRLLGAEPVLTGIRAEVAQTIVSLGLDLTGVVTRATLQEGLAHAIKLGRDRQAAEEKRVGAKSPPKARGG